ncbi:MAG TPA: molybdopterin-dependent oxidoreductase, partial [Chloroflexota bacterium]
MGQPAGEGWPTGPIAFIGHVHCLAISLPPGLSEAPNESTVVADRVNFHEFSQILGAYPRLYWNDHCVPGTEWLRFTRRKLQPGGNWTSIEQEIYVTPWLAQPGAENLSAGRHYHFFGIVFWILNGLVYVVGLFVSGEWSRLVPTSWSIVPDAWKDLIIYVTFQTPPPSEFHPLDPLQQLTYFAVVFILAPLLILTGLARSPAIEASQPWLPALFGGRQGARSIYFLGMAAFAVFIAMHLVMVLHTYAGWNLSNIVFGTPNGNHTAALGIAVLINAAIILIYWATSRYSRTHVKETKNFTGPVIRPFMRGLTLHANPRMQFRRDQIWPYHAINGYPPMSEEYQALKAGGSKDWRLQVCGLVECPRSFTLDDLKAMDKTEQTVCHNCIQGWTGIVEWGGISLQSIVDACKPMANARYMVFHSSQHDASGRPYYETLDVRLAKKPQIILAYENNWQPLPERHGAPLRLRAET